MIEHDCFKKSWIDDKRQELRVIDPGLLEKCIHALQLLGRLSEEGDFDFVFKGGTSLILLLANLRRLPIDIDIVSTAAPAEHKPVCERIGRTSPFIRFEEDERVEAALEEMMKGLHGKRKGVQDRFAQSRFDFIRELGRVDEGVEIKRC